MAHFGIICPAAIGHLNPMCVLGRELQRRNHQVTLFNIPDIGPKVISSGLNFEPIGQTNFPMGTLERHYQELGEISGLAAFKYTINWLNQETVTLLEELPDALKKAEVTALLVD
jgi:UDP:flavonoid glycosyltransferase YjiC (YdhE family)